MFTTRMLIENFVILFPGICINEKKLFANFNIVLMKRGFIIKIESLDKQNRDFDLEAILDKVAV